MLIESSEEERDDETAINVFGDASVEASGESEDLTLVVNGLEEVLLGLLRDQSEDVAERVNLISEPVVGWDLSLNRVTGLGVLNGAHVENLALLLSEEVSSELVD